MLEIRPNCECCDRDLSPASPDARICTYECTFCSGCVDRVLQNVCPNCGGALVPRPVRPVKAHRAGLGLAHQPASVKRVQSKFTEKEMAEFAESLKHIHPSDR